MNTKYGLLEARHKNVSLSYGLECKFNDFFFFFVLGKKIVKERNGNCQTRYESW